MRKEQIDVPALARQIEESVPGMLAVPVRSLEMFLHGTSEPSDAFISICGRYLARTVQSSR